MCDADRYWDDTTKAHYKPKRQYAFRKGTRPLVSENKWARFLNDWSITDLEVATGLVTAGVYADLNVKQRDMLSWLRNHYHDVLLLDREDPLHSYQTRLRTLWSYGMINLSLGSTNPALARLQRTQRSLTAQLREVRKKSARLDSALTKQVQRAERAEAEVVKQEKLLVQAQAQVNAFKLTHPDWSPPEDVLLIPDDDKDAKEIFRFVDQDLDVELQLKHDPSGMLTTFWAEQRRQLQFSDPKRTRSRRWNPQVYFQVSCTAR